MPRERSIVCYEDADAVARAAADLIIQAARDSMAARGRFTIVLSGGSTPRRMFELLSRPEYSSQIDWSETEFFWGDERPVPPNREESNYRMADRAWLSKVSVDRKKINRLQGERDDLDRVAVEYAAEMANVFGVATDGEPPALDLVLLGMGADGHTASLFPHTAALHETTRWVVANDVPQLDTRRITMTAPLLNRARTIVFLVTGAAKAQVLAEVLEGPSDPHRLPSQLIQPAAGKLIWLLDRAAAARLSPPPPGLDAVS